MNDVRVRIRVGTLLGTGLLLLWSCDEGNTSDNDNDNDFRSNRAEVSKMTPCVGGLYDPSSKLCWQDPPSKRMLKWTDSVNACKHTTRLEGENGYRWVKWHLPTISELRSLIRGCRNTKTGGLCDVTDDCRFHRSYYAPAGDRRDCFNKHCKRCGGRSTPGPRERAGKMGYWPVETTGPLGRYWSSSTLPSTFRGTPDYAWSIGSNGTIRNSATRSRYYVRCVRPGP